ncbi:MAG TPA: hypothetical protein VK904_09615 [Miltoncostaeaceae bacterium]|nr:hypothetical protein [Miltoncostaeaceae bacterium]
MIAHDRGIPSATGAILFAVGALVGFALVGVLAYGGVGRQPPPAPAPFSLWHSIHLVGVGAGIGLSVGATYALDNDAAWLAGGFLATTIYLLAAGLPSAFARRS